MSTRHAPEAFEHGRTIASLSARSGAAPAEVRALFAQELARLEMGATVRSYLPVLTASNVRALLRRKSRSRNAVGHGGYDHASLDRSNRSNREAALHFAATPMEEAEGEPGS